MRSQIEEPMEEFARKIDVATPSNESEIKGYPVQSEKTQNQRKRDVSGVWDEDFKATSECTGRISHYFPA